LRDYGVDGQIGLEQTPEEYVEKMVAVFREVRRVLKDHGTVWLNIGDSYAGSSGSGGKTEKQSTNVGSFHDGGPRMGDGLKPKDLVGIPWRVAFALQADGWWLRSDIIWSKPNPMPESVTDRPTKAHEYIFLLAKSARYYYDAEAIRESADTAWKFDQKDRVQRVAATGGAISGGTGDRVSGSAFRNKRSVWTVTTKPFPEAHFAVFPPDLIKPCVLAGCPAGGTVLDPFLGAGTTALVAAEYGRDCIGIELNPEYAAMAERRIAEEKAQIKLPGVMR
jgi:DNA modification methylase